MNLREYQRRLFDAVLQTWRDDEQRREPGKPVRYRNVLATLATGGGKTVIFSKILQHYVNSGEWVLAIAHRQELVLQMSLSLARNGVRHNLIGDPKLVKLAVWLHMEETGRNYIDPAAHCIVIGVRTLNRRADKLRHILTRIALWVMDEAHHILVGNEWGKAALRMPNARGLGVTATAGRADGRGLGLEADGLMDVIIEGPDTGDLIRDGWLTNYEVVCPQTKLDLARVAISKSTGDYIDAQLRKEIERSEIVGDAVDAYLKYTQGKLCAVFVTHTKVGLEMVDRFRDADITAEFVGHKTPDDLRVQIMQRFKRREVLVLINVDLFGEGFDLPALEAVIFARPTESLGLYLQQCGRVLRLMLNEGLGDTVDGRLQQIAASEKPISWIIDLVGNYIRHRPPDKRRVWSLAARERRNTTAVKDLPITACPACMRPYYGTKRVCPYCGHVRETVERGAPEQVEGDITILDDETRARLMGEVWETDMDTLEYESKLIGRHVPPIGRARLLRLHYEKQQTQATLRNVLQMWADYNAPMADDTAELYRIFYHKFGVDVLTAQTLSVGDARKLGDRIALDIGRTAG